MNAATLLSARDQVRDDLGSMRIHPLALLRNPGAEMASVPVGDLLCWCDGLEEEAVIRILLGAEVTWSRRLSLLTKREIEALCLQIKTRHPHTWERWREAIRPSSISTTHNERNNRC